MLHFVYIYFHNYGTAVFLKRLVGTDKIGHIASRAAIIENEGRQDNGKGEGYVVLPG